MISAYCGYEGEGVNEEVNLARGSKQLFSNHLNMFLSVPAFRKAVEK